MQCRCREIQRNSRAPILSVVVETTRADLGSPGFVHWSWGPAEEILTHHHLHLTHNCPLGHAKPLACFQLRTHRAAYSGGVEVTEVECQESFNVREDATVQSCPETEPRAVEMCVSVRLPVCVCVYLCSCGPRSCVFVFGLLELCGGKVCV